MQEQMLEKKTQGFVLSQGTKWVRQASRVGLGVLATAVIMGGVVVQAQTAGASQPSTSVQTSETPFPKKARFGSVAPVTYDNKYEVYGGINLMTFQAGQDLPKRMNLGGGELLGTWWATPRLGVGAEWRGEWGTTPVKPNPYFNGRALVGLQMGMGADPGTSMLR